MSNIEFEEDNNEFYQKTQNLLGQKSQSKMISFLLKKKIVKNEKQATIILAVFAVIIFISAFSVFKYNTQPKEMRFIDKYGIEYSTEEYINLVKSGNDPLR